MSHKITARINKKSGKVTMSVDGVTGESCTDLTKKLEQGLGMTEPERELTADYYQQTTEQQQQQST